jgi:glycosyltransferase involved in cell wall biosynthesis
MKIDYLIVAENSTPGQKIYVEQRKKMLEELGYSTEIISFPHPEPKLVYDYLRIAYTYRKKLEKYLKSVKTDIIEFYCSASILLQKKKITERFKTIASFDLPYGVNIWWFGSNILHYLERGKFKSVDRIISLTNYGKRFLTGGYKIEEEKIAWIPYTLNPCEKPRKAYDENFAISYCPYSRADRKGLDILVKAWNTAYIDKKLFITGISEKEAKKYLGREKIDMSNKIEYISWLKRDDYLKMLSRSRFFVSSSRFEDFGQAVVETLSSEKPAVSTPTIGPSEFLSQIDKNLISPSFSHADLANTINYLEEHRNDNKIKENIKRFCNNYDYFRIKKRLKEVVEDLMEQR